MKLECIAETPGNFRFDRLLKLLLSMIYNLLTLPASGTNAYKAFAQSQKKARQRI